MKSHAFLDSAKIMLVIPAACMFILVAGMAWACVLVASIRYSVDPVILESRELAFNGLWEAAKVSSLQSVYPKPESYSACIRDLEVVEMKLSSNVIANKTQFEEIELELGLIKTTLAKMKENLVDNETLRRRFRLNNIILSRSLLKSLQDLPQIQKFGFADFSALDRLFSAASITFCIVSLLSLLAAFFLGLRYRWNYWAPLTRIDQNSDLLVQRKPLLKPIPGCVEFLQIQESIAQTSQQLLAGLRAEKVLIDKSAEIICSTNADRRLVSANMFACDFFGVRADDVETFVFDSFVAAAQREILKKTFDKAVKDEKNEQCELSLLSATGELLACRLSMFWSASEKRMFCVAQDIREEKEAEFLKDYLSSMLAEDLREPLLEMRQELQLMLTENESKDPEFIDELSQMQNNCESLVTLIDDLISMQKTVSQEILLHKDVHELKSIIVGCVESIEHLAARKQLKIEVCEASRMVLCDAERVRQVITNMLSNAIKFSPDASRVSVEIEENELKSDDDIAFVKISISDEGAGVPPEQQEIIFQRFEQSSNENENSGTGLGLAISKMIVEAHGGQIGMNSPARAGVPHGSRFWFTLPIHD